MNPAAIEPVTAQAFEALLRAVRRLHGTAGLIVSGLYEADVSKGRRRLGDDHFEMWTKTRHKITIKTNPECVLISCSTHPDPECP